MEKRKKREKKSWPDPLKPKVTSFEGRGRGFTAPLLCLCLTHSLFTEMVHSIVCGVLSKSIGTESRFVVARGKETGGDW